MTTRAQRINARQDRIYERAMHLKQTQHTPTPWYITGLNPRRNIVQSVPLDSDNYVCECDSDGDASFIVRAVNSHDALVKTLEDALYTIKALDENYDIRDSYVAGDKVLTQAKGESEFSNAEIARQNDPVEIEKSLRD